MNGLTVHLVRHSKVDSHRGDVPLSADAMPYIDAAADALARNLRDGGTVRFLTTGTLRTRQTAERLRERIALAPGRRSLGEVRDEYQIRNPDIYLAGSRIEMVSSGRAMAEQLPDGTLSGEEVEALPFFASFLRAQDRIGYWLRHRDPPGEDARAVARRIVCFCRSMKDARRGGDLDVVAVTHSPVLRAVLVEYLGMADPGEPDWAETITLRFAPQEAEIEFRGVRGRLPA